jgi:hypothetical protein
VLASGVRYRLQRRGWAANAHWHPDIVLRCMLLPMQWGQWHYAGLAGRVSFGVSSIRLKERCAWGDAIFYGDARRRRRRRHVNCHAVHLHVNMSEDSQQSALQDNHVNNQQHYKINLHEPRMRMP